MAFVLYLLTAYTSLLSLTFAISCPFGDHDDGGYFTSDGDVCVYRCYDEVTVISIDDLTLAEIGDECNNVKYAARWSDCTNKDQLLWSDCCGCAFCKCSEADSGTPYSWQEIDSNYPSKYCYNCSCSATSSTDLIFKCELVSYTYDLYSWEDFPCPESGTNWDNFALCEDNGDTYTPTDYWWPDDKDCNVFCYCKAGGIKECQTGFDNIINLGSEQLKAAFWDSCRYGDIEACWSTPSLMFARQKTNSCSSPRCFCPSEYDTIDTEFYVEQDDVENAHDTVCAQCTCRQYNTSHNYATCGKSERYPKTSEYDYNCPPPRSISCHEQYNGPALEDANYVTEYSNYPELFCSIQLRERDEYSSWRWGSESSHVDVRVYDYYRASEFLICGIYGANGDCFHYSLEYKDLDQGDTPCGETKSGSRTRYMWCCSEDECNYHAGGTKIDTENCEGSNGLTTFYQTLQDCWWRDAWDEECDDEDEEEDVTCDSMKEEFKVAAACYCKAYAQLYDDAGADGVNAGWKPWIKTQTDWFMTNFEKWNDVFGCNANFDCDLTTGVLKVRSGARAIYKPYVFFILGFVSLLSLF